MSRLSRRLFYGWLVVITSALGLLLGAAPIVVFSFGVFLGALDRELHAGRGAISLAFALHNLVSAASGVVIGRLADRHGARRVILVATAIFSLGLLSALALGPSIRQLYLFYALLGVVSPATGPITYSHVVSRWFDRQRGLALGLTMFGLGLGAIVVPPASQYFIALVGWRATFAILGCAILLVPLPVLVLVLRDDPRQEGLAPDGVPTATRAPSDGGLQGQTWAETWRTREFWLMIPAFFIVGASVQGSIVHLPALLRDRGVSAQAAANASAIVGLALLLGRTGSGYFLDRFFGPRVAAWIFAQVTLGVGLLWLGSAGPVVMLAAFMVGIGLGAEADLIAYLMSRYFGLRALGTSFGVAFGCFVLAGGVGVFLMGAGFDWTRSYRVPLAGFLIAMVLAVTLMLRLGPYRWGAAGATARGQDGYC